MEHYNLRTGEYEEAPEAVEAFKKELKDLFIKHRLSVSIEWGEGFIIKKYEKNDFDFVNDAILDL